MAKTFWQRNENGIEEIRHTRVEQVNNRTTIVDTAAGMISITVTDDLRLTISIQTDGYELDFKDYGQGHGAVFADITKEVQHGNRTHSK